MKRVVLTGGAAACVLALVLRSLLGSAELPGRHHALQASVGLTGIHKIKHVVVIMQENRSFDSYFGTYPGADGIPMQNGVPTVCVARPGDRAPA